jgi:hypothetical protein
MWLVAELEVKLMERQEPAAGFAWFEVKAIGDDDVPTASSCPETLMETYGAILTVTPGSIVRTPVDVIEIEDVTTYGDPATVQCAGPVMLVLIWVSAKMPSGAPEIDARMSQRRSDLIA